MPIDFPSNPQIDELYSAEDRTWRWTGVYWRAVTTTIGYTGSQGEQGEGFRVLGSFPTVEDLPNDSSGQPGDAYVITSTGEIWVWDGFNWNNLGQFVGYTGSRGATGFTGSQGRDGNFGGVTLDYTFSANTDSSLDPGAGRLKFNDANMLSSTLMYIGDTDDFSVNLDNYLTTIDASTSEIRGHFRISRKGMPEQFVMFAITDQTVNQGSYFVVSCSYVSGNLSDSSTAFDDGDDILITFARTGDKGDTGYTGSSGFTGSQGATGTSVRIVGSLANSSLLPNPYGGDIGDGYLVEDTGHLWLWDGTSWNDIGKLTGEVGPTGFTGSQGEIGYTGSEGESTFTWGPTPPENPAIGDRWFDTIVGAVAVYVDDGDTLAWLEVAGSGFMGQTGYTGSGGPSGPRIASIDYPGDATAADPVGGETLGIVGSGFEAGAHVLLDNQAVGQVSFINSNRLELVSPAKTAGSYAYLYVINPDGGVAIHVPGVQYSGLPTWSTPSAGSIGSVYETQTINQSFGAVSDSSVTYSLASGTLPAGSTLDSATGVLSGTAGLVDNATTYTFTIRATDAESQTSDRQFSLTIDPDSITWNFPSAGSVVEVTVDEPSSVSLSASAVTGEPVGYSVSALPDGLSLTGSTVSGTATTLGDTASTLTASAATTGASAAVAITWRVVVGGDLFFKQTTLLLNGDTETFISDASDNAFTITPNGDTRPSAFSPYNTNWSNYFGEATTRIGINDATLALGTGDFEISFDWYKHISGSGQYITGTGNISNSWQIVSNSATDIQFRVNSTADIGVNGTLISGQWNNIKVTRVSGTISLYVNDVFQTSAVNTTNLSVTNLGIGSLSGTQNTFVAGGYVANYKIIKAGTTVLDTCRNNRFLDNANNLTITVVGTPKVTAFGPFTETDTSTGSGYFDGTGDYLTAASDAAFALSTGDFCIEGWFYVYSNKNYNIYFDFRNGTGTAVVPYLYSTATGDVDYYVNGGSRITASGAIKTGQWSHIAVIRSGTATKLFINGVQIGSTYTDSNNYVQGPLYIGRNNGGGTTYDASYYCAGFRVVKGTTGGYGTPGATITPPTAPLTAITNTSLLTLQNRVSYGNKQPIDESGIKNVITNPSGSNASIGSFSPHVPTGWSGYFDGTGDYLQAQSNAVPATDEFSMECWIYTPDVSTRQHIASQYTNGSTNGRWYFATSYNAAGQINFVNNGFNRSVDNALVANRWTHVVVTRTNINANPDSDYRIFVDGVLSDYYQYTGTAARSLDTARTRIGGEVSSSTIGYVEGYISNFRVVTGIAPEYQTESTTIDDVIFTPPTAPLEPIAGTSLLTLRGPSFTDDGPNRLAITRNGDTRITPFSPFAPHTIAPDSYSVYFDETDSLNADGSALVTTTDDFTVEFWIYPTSTATQNFLLLNGNGSGYGLLKLYFANTSLIIRVSSSGSAWVFNESFGSVPGPNQWYHIAVVRESDVIKVYIDGTLSYTSVLVSTLYNGTIQEIGTDIFTGYISNLRIVNGTAVYTEDFDDNLPTAPLTAISGTSLFTCQSPTIIDNSTNEFAITVNGNSQPTRFNPFGETVTDGVEYSPTAHGGSVYFPYSAARADFLTIASSNDLAFGTGPYTVEFYVYLDGYVGADNRILDLGSANNSFAVSINSAGRIDLAKYGAVNVFSSSSGVITTYGWYHVAIVRSSTGTNDTKIYCNGVLVGTGTDANNWTVVTTPRICGSAAFSLDFKGYLTDLRIIKGSVYTSAFVPPTAPVDPIAGSTLLINGTNAAILDQTGRNVVETVGNARVVNGVRKYGSGAMYFDGTGDWLIIPNNEWLDFGSGDFTIEVWIYVTSSSPSEQTFFGKRVDNNNFSPLLLGVFKDGSVYKSLMTGSTTGNSWNLNSSFTKGSATIPLNTWVHLAFVRNGTTFTTYADGVQDFQVTGISGSLMKNTLNATVGASALGGTNVPFFGLLDDFRITKGVARYTENSLNFPPTQSHRLK